MVNKFLVGALLLLLIFPAYAIELPEELPVYKLASVDVRLEDKAGAFLETFFGDVRGGESRELDDRYVFEIDGKSLEVYKSSGGIWYEDKNRLWNFSITNVSLPDERKAKEIADAFLSSKSLLPLNRSIDRTESVLSIDYLGTGGTKIKSVDLRNNTTDYVRQMDIQINYGLKVKDNDIDLPVVGGGGDICVVLGDQGDLIAYSGTRPGLEAILEGSYQVIPLEQANASYEEMAGDLKSINYSIDLAYYLPPNTVNQSYLIPVYVYRGKLVVDNKTIPIRNTFMPATVFPMTIYSTEEKFIAREEKNISSAEDISDENRSASRLCGDKPSNDAGASWMGLLAKPPLKGSKKNAQGFVDELSAAGWSIKFNWGSEVYPNAWESDWNQNENSWIDDVDIVFYTGHASENGWQLSPPKDSWLDRSEVQRRYGDCDLEWITIAACGPLEDRDIMCSGNAIDAVNNWGPVFNGLHGLLGYAAVTADNEEEGRRFVKYMKQGDTVVNSWFRTAREVQDATNGWACPYGRDIYAAALVPYQGTISASNDHLWGYGSVSSDIPNPYKFWLIWTHC